MSRRANYADDQLPLDNDRPVSSEDGPYHHVCIFRRDMVDTSKPIPLSVDTTVKRFTDFFCEFDSKRCKLCNESFHHWHSHNGGIPHEGREGLALELVRAYCGTPKEVAEMLSYRLKTDSSQRRVASLSHDLSRERKRRLQYLLQFLIDRRVLIDTFNVSHQMGASAGRSWEFERLEWVGDNVVKYTFNNILSCLFPVWEGGIRSRLGYSQFVIDGNEGLARAYDYLELQKFTKTDRVVSKFKSDVVETLFGELQLYLWSTEEDTGIDSAMYPFTPEMLPLRCIVAHTMDELAQVMFLYHLDGVRACVERVIQDNDLHCVKADPLLRNEKLSDMSLQSYRRNSTSPSPTMKLSQARVPFKQHRSQQIELTNYHRFKLVVPLGGLLPLPFHSTQLTPSVAFLPHLKADPRLSQRPHMLGASFAPPQQDSYQAAHDALFTELPAKQTPLPTFSVNELMDHQLIHELL